MSLSIKFSELWTYNTKIPPNQRSPSEKKSDISNLSEKEFTHIHGDLSIEIDGRKIPKMGYNSSSDVCLGYWIEELVRLFETLDGGHNEYTIHGMDQGMPGYLFEKRRERLYLSIIKSLNGGKPDPEWKLVEIDYRELKMEFNKFRQDLLVMISDKAPRMQTIWNQKFCKR